MKIASAILASSLIVSVSAAQANCSYKVGDTVTMENGRAIVERIQGYRLASVKSEFETTAEYEARRSMMKAGHSPDRRTVVRGPLDLEYVYYNADESSFWIGEFAWDNWSVSWDEALPNDILRMNKRFKPFLVRGVAVQYSTEKASTPMSAKQTRMTALYRDYKGFSEDRADLEWQFDGRDVFPNAKPSKELAAWGDGFMPYNYIRVSVPRDVARNIKSSLRIGFEVTPREPYLYRSAEKLGNENDKNHVDLVSVWMHCGLITDAENRVWGILKPTLP